MKVDVKVVDFGSAFAGGAEHTTDVVRLKKIINQCVCIARMGAPMHCENEAALMQLDEIEPYELIEDVLMQLARVYDELMRMMHQPE